MTTNSVNFAAVNVWADRASYEDAECKFFEWKQTAQNGIEAAKVTLTPLADEVARARQRLINIRNNFDTSAENITCEASAISFIEKKYLEFDKVINSIQDQLNKIDSRLRNIENKFEEKKQSQSCAANANKIAPKTTAAVEDEDVDLFASDSDDEEVDKVKEQRLAEYNAKKSKKPALIAKSSIVLDIKPWDDETNMQVMEEEVRKIEMDGLLWGASKLVPLAYGIKKLQISCVVEDEKVSVDLLQEQIEANENYVQSVDIAAFNKI